MKDRKLLQPKIFLWHICSMNLKEIKLMLHTAELSMNSLSVKIENLKKQKKINDLLVFYQSKKYSFKRFKIILTHYYLLFLI
jgi:hypothetical protein